jgi:hypothetical protein
MDRPCFDNSSEYVWPTEDPLGPARGILIPLHNRIFAWANITKGDQVKIEVANGQFGGVS